LTLFERIHNVIKKHFDNFEHRGEEIAVPDTEALAQKVIDAHAEHAAEDPSSEREAFPDGVPDPISPKPDEAAK
jgi:hypothetical protein